MGIGRGHPAFGECAVLSKIVQFRKFSDDDLQRNGLRLGRELLASPARLATGRGLGPIARTAAGKTACGQPDRLLTCHCRFLVDSSGWGGPKTGPNPTDRARPGSKHHLATDAHGTPLAIILTGANRNDVTQLLPLIEALPAIRGQRGRPLQRPDRVYADHGYDHDKYRRQLHAIHIPTAIARRGKPLGGGTHTRLAARLSSPARALRPPR